MTYILLQLRKLHCKLGEMHMLESTQIQADVNVMYVT